MSSRNTHVTLMSATRTVRVPTEYICLWYCRRSGRPATQKNLQWAKSRLLSFGCEPCIKCDNSGQKNLKHLGALKITIKKGSEGSSNPDMDVVLPVEEYFLQNTEKVKIPA